MNIFVDCDVLLDVALGRDPFLRASGAVLNHLQAHPEQGFVAWHSIANLYYIVSKTIGKEPAKRFIVRLCRFVKVVPTGTADVLRAADLPLSDFEDAMQCAAALACRSDVIVTRNVSDYGASPVKALTPEDLLASLEVSGPGSE